MLFERILLSYDEKILSSVASKEVFIITPSPFFSERLYSIE